jgi:hypothetical protein
MDSFTPDAFVYVVLVVLVIIVCLMWNAIDVLKDRVSTLERQMRELHRAVIQILPNEE